MIKTSIGFKIGIVTSLLHLGMALLAYNAFSGSCSSTAGLVFLPFFFLDAPINLLIFFLGDLGVHIPPLIQFGVLGSALWFLIPWLTGRVIERRHPHWTGLLKCGLIIVLLPVYCILFLGLVQVQMGLDNRDRRPVELKKSLASTNSDYLDSRVVFSAKSPGPITSINSGLWRQGSGREILVTHSWGTVLLNDAFVPQQEVEFTNYFTTIVPAVQAGDQNIRMLGYRHYESATLLNSEGNVIWNHAERSEKEGPIDGALCGDIDGDGTLEFAVHRRYNEGLKLLDENGKTVWAYPASSIGCIVMADVRGNGKDEFFFKNGSGGTFITLDAAGRVVEQLKIAKAPTEFVLVKWPEIQDRPNLLLPAKNAIRLVDMKGNAIMELDAPGCRSYGEINAVAVRFQKDQPAHLAVRKILAPDIVVLYVYDANGTLVFQKSETRQRGSSSPTLAVIAAEGSDEEKLLAGQWKRSGKAQVVEYALSPDAKVAPKNIKLTLLPEDAVIEGGIQLEQKPTGQCLGYWNNPEDVIRYNIADLEEGTYEVILKYAAPDGHGGKLTIKLDEQIIEQTLGSTGSWDTPGDQSFGTYEHKGGALDTALSILQSNQEKSYAVNVFSMTLEKK